jgi:hypothetical protein
MPTNEWPARVFDRDHPADGGTGLLIDHQRVLTCAHVVDRMAHPTVRFPARPDLGEIPAVAHIPSRWRCGDDAADVAVLHLDRPVPLRPARFAPLHTLDSGLHDLVAIGFPRNTDERGRIAPVAATTSHFLLQGEWIQLESTTAFGPSVGKGYSGSAVVLRSTSEVVGIVTAADRGERLGLMLPLAKLVEHCEDLADLLPLGPIGPRGHRELRALLIDMPLANAHHSYQIAIQNDLFPALPVTSPRAAGHDAYAVACHIADGLFLDDPKGHTIRQCLARLCHHLASEIADHEIGEALRSWADRYGLPETASRPTRSSASNFRLVVRIARSGADTQTMLLDVMVHAPSGTTDRVHQARTSAPGIRGAVEDLLPQVISAHVPPDAGLMVEFVLPRTWLSKPVDEWTLGRRGTVRVGWRHPVVVRDLAQFEHRTDQREAQRRWATLRAAAPGEDLVYWVRCGDRPTARHIAASLASELHRVVLALTNPPERLMSNAALRAGFDNGIPLMLWRRLPCADHGCDDSDGVCDGQRFETALAEEIERFLTSSPASELPEMVRQLRTAAARCGDEERHCGRALTLLWNPPEPPPRIPRLGLTELGELR